MNEETSKFTMDEETSNFEKKVLEHEGERLTYYTEISNKDQETEKRNKLFINLSVRDILRGVSQTVISVMNDLVAGKVTDIYSFISVITEENRIIYIGILLLFISFCVYLIDITD